jgi:uncharacterized membrane protein YkoI
MNWNPIMAMVLSLGLLAAPLTAHADDRAPTPDERSAIEAALKNLGFSTWTGIEMDDGRWEVDDAMHSDGQKYDVELDPKTLAVIKQKRDD